MFFTLPLPSLRRLLLLLLLAACVLPAARAQAPLFFANDATTVRGISFKFVESQTFTEGEIKNGALLATQEPSFFDKIKNRLAFLPFISRTTYPLVPIELQKDVVRLRQFYRLNGFLKADIDYPASQLDTASNSIRVIFTVDEGPPLLIDTVAIQTPEGTRVGERFGEENTRRWRRFRQDSPLREGERFTSTDFALARGSTLDWVRNRGYAFVTLRADSVVDAANDRIRLSMTVDPGPYTVVDTILIEGNESVPDHVVRRELPLQVGEPFSQQKLVEGQRELFGLDLFRVAVADVPEQPRDSTVTVRYTVREAKLRLIRAQTGYGLEDGIVLEPSWTHRNFLGGARRLTVTGEYRSGLGAQPGGSFEPITRLGVTAALRQPYLYSRKLSGIFAPFYLREENPNIRSYYQEIGATTTLLYELMPFRTVSAAYTYARAYPLRQDAGLGSGIYNRSVVSASATLGKVDDFLNPKRGTLVRPLFEESGNVIPSGVQYVKTSLEVVRYQPLRGPVNFAARLYGGRMWPSGQSTNQTDPVIESRFDRIRFYAGGASDVRGWGLQQLGPQLLQADSVFTPIGGTVGGRPDSVTVANLRYEPIGGLAKLAGNLEVRLPFPGLGPAWGTAAFLDFGQVTEGSLRPKDLRFGTGAGIRYETPIGYVRLDLGFKLNPSDFDLYSPAGYYCRVNGIAEGSACETLTGEDGGASAWRRLQVHISIGQAF